MTRAAALFCIFWLAGCAYIGPPKPPALDIPTRITDLRAAEYGDQILVQFTVGALTTDGLALTSCESGGAASGRGGFAANIARTGEGARTGG